MKNKNNIISIHSLHTEGDTAFLGRWNGAGHFNPLPPHGGRPGLYKTVRFQKSISIHSLHTEGDFLELMGGLTEEISIHSLHTEGDANTFAERSETQKISIHSLHTEGDIAVLSNVLESGYFNPLPPHGGRR